MTSKSKQGAKTVGGTAARAMSSKTGRMRVGFGKAAEVNVTAIELEDAYKSLFSDLPTWVSVTLERPGAKRRREAFNRVVEAAARKVVVQNSEDGISIVKVAPSVEGADLKAHD